MSDQGATPPPATDSGGSGDSNAGGQAQGSGSGNQSAGGGGQNRQNRSNNNAGNRNTSYVSDHPKDWKGDCEDIGVVLGIKAEKLNNQGPVDAVLERLESYAKKNFDYYEDILCLITDEEDPEKKIEAERATLLSDEQKKLVEEGDVVELGLMKDVITRYGNRKVAVKKNVGKIFELVWGQCTTSVKTLIKGEDTYDENKKKNNVTWLIQQARRLTSGVDNEADGADVYFQALWEWTHIRQHENETKDAYQKRADTLTQNLILAGGEQVLYPKKLFPSSVSDANNPKET